MISEYPVPEYYLNHLDLDFDPHIGETIQGVVSLNFEIEDPELTSDPAGFKCETEFTFDLYVDGEAPWEVDDEESSAPIGEVNAAVDVFLPGPQDNYREHYEVWTEDSYEALDEEFIYHLESGILQHVLNPVGDLLANAYNGLVPRMRFSSTLPDDDHEETDT